MKMQLYIVPKEIVKKVNRKDTERKRMRFRNGLKRILF